MFEGAISHVTGIGPPLETSIIQTFGVMTMAHTGFVRLRLSRDFRLTDIHGEVVRDIPA